MDNHIAVADEIWKDLIEASSVEPPFLIKPYYDEMVKKEEGEGTNAASEHSSITTDINNNSSSDNTPSAVEEDKDKKRGLHQPYQWQKLPCFLKRQPCLNKTILKQC
jgi:hypothetical protein